MFMILSNGLVLAMFGAVTPHYVVDVFFRARTSF